MGEVWQATDTRLGRSVALKLLPDAFAADPARLERFEREAKLLAALSHANIAGLFALEEVRPDGAAGPVRFLAMELVLGEDLAERLRRGPIPPEEAIDVARQIAEALEEAHEKGIVHRDLKPANVKVTPDGKVKVLDFGLAKAWSGDTASGSVPDLSQSPTLAHTGTAAGLILGTAGYMSPEQARGRAVDKRADVWAFGVVLFETLSGTRLFDGETVSDTLAAVLRQEIDWSALPSSTPPTIRSLLRRCLEREPKKRLRDIGEARIALTDSASIDSGVSSTPAARTRGVVPWLVAAAALVAAAFLATRERAPKAEARLLQLDVQLADDLQLGSLLGHTIALSPDGTRLVFVALSGSEPALYLRTLDQPTFTLVPDTVRAQQPFFSPDGREVGYFAGNELRRVSLAGGASNLVVGGGDARGASWGEDGTIVYSASQSGALMRVSASGGTPKPLTTLDPARGERSHRWPWFLPGGRQLLMNVNARNLTYDDAGIELVDLDSGRRRALDATGAEPRFAEGRLLFVRRGRLHAAPLDLTSARLTSGPVVLAQGVHSDLRSGSAHYAVSQSGLVAFVQGQEQNAQRLVEWRDRAGAAQPFLERPALYLSPRFSPDGSRLAVQIGELGREDVYVASTAGGTLTRLTFDDESDFSPVWSPDGTRILHGSIANNLYFFSIRNADGSGTARRVYEAHIGALAIPTAWSPDGATVLFHEQARGTGLDLRALDLASGEARVLASTPSPELDGCFSPDGRFVVYSAGSQGAARQIYVRPLADGGGHWQLSTEGGVRPVWLRSGEIVYQRLGRPISDWISVPVRTSGASIVAGAPRTLFRGRVDAEPLLRTWDVSPDGARFAVVQPIGTTAEAPGVRVRLLLGWTQLLAAGGGEPR
jgi:Tol biopolymer transport system component